MGHKRALAFLDNFGSIKEFLASDETHSIVKKKKLRKLWKRNRLVIGLKPFYKKFIKSKTKLTYYKDKSEPKFSKRRLVAFCIDWNISMFRKKSFYSIGVNDTLIIKFDPSKLAPQSEPLLSGIEILLED